MKRIARLLLILGTWAVAIYANYSHPSNWEFIKQVYRSPFVIAAIVLMVVYYVVNDYLEYRIECKGADAQDPTKSTIRARYERAYGKDNVLRLQLVTLAASLLC